LSIYGQLIYIIIIVRCRQTNYFNVILILVFSNLLQGYFYVCNEWILVHLLLDDIIDYYTIHPIKSK
ncbi:hypothetical protein, partial [Bacillus wiedmannii]|uniref:hypothetical protein n=1 Tax=Bacillus wiedmannii TaxID=1890302 RepID=UPI001C3F27E9